MVELKAGVNRAVLNQPNLDLLVTSTEKEIHFISGAGYYTLMKEMKVIVCPLWNDVR